MMKLDDIRKNLGELYPLYTYLRELKYKGPWYRHHYEQLQDLIGRISYLEYCLVQRLGDLDNYLRDD